MLRARRRAQGLVELKVWVSPNDADKIRSEAQKSVKRHIRRCAAARAEAEGQQRLFD